MIVPEPTANDVPYNDPITRLLDAGEQMAVTFSPTKQVTQFILPILAISKHPESSYEAWMDGERVYGPAPVPPTDIDDLAATFIPARRFSSSLTIYVRNLSETTTRRYTVQPLGWEVAQ
ncbi:hypothetical protein [Haloarcula argentinensis]|uniref:Uncharacterized protein n=1 Tax=Haloarcula argentinensis TaxID=43776 RepID=A0A830FQ50_HALAR|nr:hypothetical protein [Haloarcula argentinensis]GGM26826.1 hypothetical protein GCM10009006_05390 [Haloarcula argentinensis]